jgi:hypothetical protein
MRIYVDDFICVPVAETEASVTCQKNTMLACLKRNLQLSITSSDISPPCSKAVKQTNNGGFCYDINLAKCEPLQNQSVSRSF